MTTIALHDYLDQINQLLENSQIGEAAAHCRHILQKFPRHVDTYRSLGQALLEQGKHEDATDLFHRVLSANPNDFIAHLGLAIIHEEKKAFAQSVWHMERAYEMKPYDPIVQEKLKELYGHNELPVPEKLPINRGALARFYLRGELYQQAIAELKESLVQDEDRIDLRILLAETLWRSNQRVEAAEVSREILAKLPNCIQANAILADVNLATGQGDEARRYLQLVQDLIQADADHCDIETAVGKALSWDGAPFLPERVELEFLADLGADGKPILNDDWVDETMAESELDSEDSEGMFGWLREDLFTGELDPEDAPNTTAAMESLWLVDQPDTASDDETAVTGMISDWLQDPEDEHDDEIDGLYLADELDIEAAEAEEGHEAVHGLEESADTGVLSDLAPPDDGSSDWLKETAELDFEPIQADPSMLESVWFSASDADEEDSFDVPEPIADEDAEWLAMLGPAETAALDDVDAAALDALTGADSEDEKPDWMQLDDEPEDALKDEGSALEPDLIDSRESEFDNLLDDEVIREFASSGRVAPEETDDSVDSAFEDDELIPDWLKSQAGEAAPTVVPTSPVERSFGYDEDLPDWLDQAGSTDSEVSDEADSLSAPEDMETEAGIPAWLGDEPFDTAAGVNIVEQAFDSLGLGDGPLTDSGGDLADDSLSVTDWLSSGADDVDLLDGGSAEAVPERGLHTADLSKLDDEIPDWLKVDESDVDGGTQVVRQAMDSIGLTTDILSTSGTGLTDWLDSDEDGPSEEGDKEQTLSEFEQEGEAAQSRVIEDLTGWLNDGFPSPDETAAAEPDEDLMAFSDEIEGNLGSEDAEPAGASESDHTLPGASQLPPSDGPTDLSEEISDWFNDEELDELAGSELEETIVGKAGLSDGDLPDWLSESTESLPGESEAIDLSSPAADGLESGHPALDETLITKRDEDYEDIVDDSNEADTVVDIPELATGNLSQLLDEDPDWLEEDIFDSDAGMDVVRDTMGSLGLSTDLLSRADAELPDWLDEEENGVSDSSSLGGSDSIDLDIEFPDDGPVADTEEAIPDWLNDDPDSTLMGMNVLKDTMDSIGLTTDILSASDMESEAQASQDAERMPEQAALDESTEHLSDGLSQLEAEDALPDWLDGEQFNTQIGMDVVAEAMDSMGLNTDILSASDSDLPAWLQADVEESPDEEEPVEAEAGSTDIPSDGLTQFGTDTPVPGWLDESELDSDAGIDVVKQAMDSMGLTTDILSKADADLPDWLQEDAAGSLESEASEEAAAAPVENVSDGLSQLESDALLPEWLEEKRQDSDAGIDVVKQTMDSIGLTTDILSSTDANLPDWLDGSDDSDQGESEETLTEAPEYASDGLSQLESDEPLPDWLDAEQHDTEMGMDVVRQAMDSMGLTTDILSTSDADLPDWLQGDEDIVADLPESGDADSGDAKFEVDEEFAAEVASLLDEDDIPDWLKADKYVRKPVGDKTPLEPEDVLAAETDAGESDFLQALDPVSTDVQEESVEVDETDSLLDALEKAGTGTLTDLDAEILEDSLEDRAAERLMSSDDDMPAAELDWLAADDEEDDEPEDPADVEPAAKPIGDTAWLSTFTADEHELEQELQALSGLNDEAEDEEYEDDIGDTAWLAAFGPEDSDLDEDMPDADAAVAEAYGQTEEDAPGDDQVEAVTEPEKRIDDLPGLIDSDDELNEELPVLADIEALIVESEAEAEAAANLSGDDEEPDEAADVQAFDAAATELDDEQTWLEAFDSIEAEPALELERDEPTSGLRDENEPTSHVDAVTSDQDVSSEFADSEPPDAGKADAADLTVLEAGFEESELDQDADSSVPEDLDEAMAWLEDLAVEQEPSAETPLLEDADDFDLQEVLEVPDGPADDADLEAEPDDALAGDEEESDVSEALDGAMARLEELADESSSFVGEPLFEEADDLEKQTVLELPIESERGIETAAELDSDEELAGDVEDTEVPEDLDGAMSWLEDSAAKQGAPAAELLSAAETAEIDLEPEAGQMPAEPEPAVLSDDKVEQPVPDQTDGMAAVPEDLDDAMAWLEELAAKQGAPVEELPSVADITAPEAELDLEALDELDTGTGSLSVPDSELPTVQSGAMADVPEDLDEAMAWLEELAAKQGAPVDELPTIAEVTETEYQPEEDLAIQPVDTEPAEELAAGDFVDDEQLDGTGVDEDVDDAMTWLDGLAEKESKTPVEELSQADDLEPDPDLQADTEVELPEEAKIASPLDDALDWLDQLGIVEAPDEGLESMGVKLEVDDAELNDALDLLERLALDEAPASPEPESSETASQIVVTPQTEADLDESETASDLFSEMDLSEEQTVLDSKALAAADEIQLAVGSEETELESELVVDHADTDVDEPDDFMVRPTFGGDDDDALFEPSVTVSEGVLEDGFLDDVPEDPEAALNWLEGFIQDENLFEESGFTLDEPDESAGIATAAAEESIADDVAEPDELRVQPTFGGDDDALYEPSVTVSEGVLEDGFLDDMPDDPEAALNWLEEFVQVGDLGEETESVEEIDAVPIESVDSETVHPDELRVQPTFGADDDALYEPSVSVSEGVLEDGFLDDIPDDPEAALSWLEDFVQSDDMFEEDTAPIDDVVSAEARRDEIDGDVESDVLENIPSDPDEAVAWLQQFASDESSEEDVSEVAKPPAAGLASAADDALEGDLLDGLPEDPDDAMAWLKDLSEEDEYPSDEDDYSRLPDDGVPDEAIEEMLAAASASSLIETETTAEVVQAADDSEMVDDVSDDMDLEDIGVEFEEKVTDSLPGWLTLESDDEDVPTRTDWLRTLPEPDVAGWLEAEDEATVSGVYDFDVAMAQEETKFGTGPLPELDSQPEMEEDLGDLQGTDRLDASVVILDESQLTLARQTLIVGDFNEAIEAYQSLLEKGDGLSTLIADLESASSKYSGQPMLRRLLGDAYMRNGQLQKALDNYRQALDQM